MAQLLVAATLISGCAPATTETAMTAEPDIGVEDDDVGDRREATQCVLLVLAPENLKGGTT